MLNRKLFKKTLWLLPLGLLLISCMTQDPTRPGPDSPTGPIIEDKELIAGASSRTTWPPDLVGDTAIQVKWRTGKDLIFLFTFLDSNFQSVGFKVSGTLTLFKISGIPALDSTPRISLTFNDLDSLSIAGNSLVSLLNPGQDTVQFNVLIETNRWGNSFLMGYVYHKSTNVFLDPASSLTPANSIFLDRVARFYHGPFDTTGLALQPTDQSHTALSFYIPGSSYYWPARMDSLHLGPLPEGNYPLRLLKVSEAAGGKEGSEVEIYEVLELDVQPKAFKVGKRIMAMTSNKSISPRPYGQR